MEARVTSRGRVVIPAALRRKYGIDAGTRLIIREVDDQIVVMTMESYVRSLRGKLKGKGGMKSLQVDREFEVGQ